MKADTGISEAGDVFRAASQQGNKVMTPSTAKYVVRLLEVALVLSNHNIVVT